MYQYCICENTYILAHIFDFVNTLFLSVFVGFCRIKEKLAQPCRASCSDFIPVLFGVSI